MGRVKSSNVTPPSSITGVTETTIRQTCSPDWFSLTFKEGCSSLVEIEKEVQRQFPESTPINLPFGGKGYRRTVKIGAAKILYDGSDSMGIHVELSGGAIRGCRDFFDFASFAYESGASCSRFDLAYDDKTGEFIDIERIEKSCRDSAQLGAFNKFRVVHQQTNAGKMTGHGVYLGSRESNVFARAYNKLLEQQSKGINEDLPEVWNRLEFELKGDVANAAFSRYIEEGKTSLKSILYYYSNRYLSFRIPSETDSRRSRWAVAGWWSAFLSELPKAEILLEKVVPSLIKKALWFSKSVKKSFAILLKSPLFGADWLQDQVEQGLNAMTLQDKALSSGVSI